MEAVHAVWGADGGFGAPEGEQCTFGWVGAVLRLWEFVDGSRA